MSSCYSSDTATFQMIDRVESGTGGTVTVGNGDFLNRREGSRVRCSRCDGDCDSMVLRFTQMDFSTVPSVMPSRIPVVSNIIEHGEVDPIGIATSSFLMISSCRS